MPTDFEHCWHLASSIRTNIIEIVINQIRPNISQPPLVNCIRIDEHTGHNNPILLKHDNEIQIIKASLHWRLVAHGECHIANGEHAS
jgi:hypothetical protein